MVNSSAYTNTGTQISVFLVGEMCNWPDRDQITTSPIGALGFLSTAQAGFTDSNNNQSLSWVDQSAGGVGVKRGTASAKLSSSYSAPLNVPYVAFAEDDSQTMTFGVNGQQATGTSVGSQFNITKFSVGTELNGNNFTPGSAYKGWIGEVLVYNTALGTADRQAVLNYLNAKWSGILPLATPVSLTAPRWIWAVSARPSVLSGDATSRVLIGSATFTIGNGATGGTATFAGTITGSGGLVIMGSGTTVLSGNNTIGAGITITNTGTTILSGNNTFAGSAGLTIFSNAGTVVLSGANTVTGPTSGIGTATIVVNHRYALQNSTLLSWGGQLLFGAPETQFTLGELAGGSELDLQNTAGIPIILSVGSNGANTTFVGIISDGIASGGKLVKVGTGTLTLDNAQGGYEALGSLPGSNYSGGTEIQNGTLSSPTATDSATRRVTVGPVTRGTSARTCGTDQSGLPARRPPCRSGIPASIEPAVDDADGPDDLSRHCRRCQSGDCDLRHARQ